MSLNRPTLSEIIARVRGDIQTRMGGVVVFLRHSVLDVLARVLAGVAAGLYGYLDWLARQLMPDTAEAEYLARHASIWNVDRKAASPARGSATATGINGRTIPAGTEAQRSDDTRYVTLADATIGGETATLQLEAVDAGTDSSLTIGEQLTLSSAIVGVNATITIIAAGEAGEAEEDDQALRARLLSRIRTPPKGGAKSDYEAWALTQDGVTRAWCYPLWMGPGTVGLTFVMDARENILPLDADVTAVQDALDILRPVTAELFVFSPPPAPLDVVLRVSPDTPAVRAAIAAELDDFFAREAEPGGTIWFSRLSEAISLAEGEFRHVIENAGDDFTAPAGSLPVLGTVTFVS